MSENQLEFVKGGTDAGLNVLLYGPPKSGKTVGACSAPGPVLLVNGDRPNASRYAHKLHPDLEEVRPHDLSTLIGIIELLTGDKNRFKTIVIDPVSELYRLVLEGLSGRALSPQIQMYGDSGTHLERFARMLCELPVNTIFTAWEMREKNEETGGYERLPFVTTKSGSAVFAGKLMAMVDVIGYTGIVTEDGQEPRYMAQLIDTKGRRGGDRFGVLGPARDVNIAEWDSEIDKAIAA